MCVNLACFVNSKNKQCPFQIIFNHKHVSFQIYRRKARKLSKMAKKGALGSLNATEKCTEIISADGRVARVGTGRPVGRPPVHGYKRNAAEELGPGCKVSELCVLVGQL
jgi:hypothetical protein